MTERQHRCLTGIYKGQECPKQRVNMHRFIDYASVLNHLRAYQQPTVWHALFLRPTASSYEPMLMFNLWADIRRTLFDD